MIRIFDDATVKFAAVIFRDAMTKFHKKNNRQGGDKRCEAMHFR